MKSTIDFGWDNDEEEQLRRWVKLSAKKKLEWLHEMHAFTLKAWTKKQKENFWKSRQQSAFE